jgi:ATP-dependent Lon protease
MKTVLIPEDNAKDLAEIPDNVKSGLEILPVSRMGEVLTHSLTRQPEPTEWTEEEQAAASRPPATDDEAGTGMVAH